jgi:hypothetical protein
VILAAEEYSSPLEIAYVLVVVVLGWYVLPRVVIPALGRWMTRRRGGPPSERVTRTSTAIMAVMLTAFVIAASWNRDLGRPTVGALLALVVSMLFALWWRDNRRGDWSRLGRTAGLNDQHPGRHRLRDHRRARLNDRAHQRRYSGTTPVATDYVTTDALGSTIGLINGTSTSPVRD